MKENDENESNGLKSENQKQNERRKAKISNGGKWKYLSNNGGEAAGEKCVAMA